MPTLSVPVQAQQTETNSIVSVNAGPDSAGQRFVPDAATENVRVINHRSARWSFEVSTDGVTWARIEPGKSKSLDVDATTTSVLLRLAEFGVSTMLIDVVAVSKPAGLASPRGSDVLSATRATDLRAMRGRFCSRLFGANDSSGAIANWTLHTTHKVQGRFWGVRAHVFNNANVAVAGIKVQVAVSKNVSGGVCVATEAWTTMTFAGASALANLPAQIAAGVPAYASSDIMPIASVDRDDGGSGLLVMCRMVTPSGGGNTLYPRATSCMTSWADFEANGAAAAYHNADVFSTPGSFNPTESQTSNTVVLEFFGAGDTVMYCGDSTTQGALGSGENKGGCRIAVRALQDLGYAVTHYNGGWTSQSSDTYFANALRSLDLCAPTIGALCPWSPNDSDKYTAAGTSRVMALAARWIAECRQRDVTPALVTPCPVGGITAPQEAERRRVVALIKSLCVAASVRCIDRDAVLTNYDVATGGFLAGLGYNTVHPSNAGYAAEGAVWLREITAVIKAKQPA